MKDKLLASGISAGPLFVTVSLTQAFTREGFDLNRHPLSLLSLGDIGWVQIANFVTTGALNLACAAGMRRALRERSGGVWGPAFVAGYGAGLIMAGVFVTDPGAGFPPGAPLGAPERMSWHAVLHEIGFLVSLVSWTVACSIFTRTFLGAGQRGWGVACLATVAAVLGIALWPDLSSISVRLVLATALQMGFVAALAARIRGWLPGSVKFQHQARPVLARG
ncbi:MAG TPA: DUF998 domain-containing protein [Propionibacteriaceae bacterium]|jgi:hypothetical protein|nr:DUF998 domain-containing protein [Propionibacteriaceae bacterium]